MNIPEVGNNYRIVLEREEGSTRMHIQVELYSKLFQGDMNALKKLNREIGENSGTYHNKSRIEFMEPGSLPPSEGKQKE
jgi:phenylacetate-CoA ligase